MNTIRVLLANHPLMVPDAIRKLVEEQDDMELVGDCRGPMMILQEVGRTKADVVILVQGKTEELGLVSQLLSVYPDLTILSMTPDMTWAYTEQLCSYRRDLAMPQKHEVIQTLRAAVREPCHKQQIK